MLMVEIAEHCVPMPSKLDFIVIDSDVAETFDISPAVGDCDVVFIGSMPCVRPGRLDSVLLAAIHY
jgi:hypothetical protein